MSANTLLAQLQRLTYGLADQLIVRGTPLTYEGGRLRPSEVVDLGLPSLLCLADELSRRVGTGAIGFDFALVDRPNPVFPLDASPRSPRPFIAIAPYLVEAFEQHVVSAEFEVAHVFAAAARVLDPQFDLSQHTTYRAGDRSLPAPLPSHPATLTR